MKLTLIECDSIMDSTAQEIREIFAAYEALVASMKAHFIDPGSQYNLNESWFEFSSWVEPFFRPPCLELSLFVPWYLFVWRSRIEGGAEDSCPVNRWVHKMKGSLTPRALEILSKCSEQRPQFYRIVRSETEYRFINVLTGEGFWIHECGSTEHLKDGNLVFAMICPWTGQHAFVMGCGAQIPDRFEKLILEEENLSIVPKGLNASAIYDRFSSELLEIYDDLLRVLKQRR